LEEKRKSITLHNTPSSTRDFRTTLKAKTRARLLGGASDEFFPDGPTARRDNDEASFRIISLRASRTIGRLLGENNNKREGDEKKQM
jgi:hypothetical protein